MSLCMIITALCIKATMKDMENLIRFGIASILMLRVSDS